ncbi:uncharacterized protein LOC111699155 [Eurytemora carolleeae]|uniref:uncharacterized protein LOC111699155 n=1 Tax=Eurytemora carolleeae TaxID=1294199 RepID=UPI000C770742|nr:uncharacterized protein LOC111699155 [Eurytemora carolleeae]|eukprot:XP_023325517.1 uncharacterized protein LOC111699155 [Eurytemora affinis]
MHWECRLTYTKLPMVIELFFSEDISHLNINLNKVDPNLHLCVLRSIMAMLTKLPRRNFPLLRSFVIRGMTHRSDYYITQLEEIVSELQQSASNLENLYLLTASNIVLGSVAQMKNLRAFRCDHSVNLSRRGIGLLCRKDAASRTTLEVLHIGIYKHSRFVKEDASILLRSLENLKEFSFLDERRCLLRVPWGEGGVGEKVFAYSTFKTAIKQHEKKMEEEKRKLRMRKEKVDGDQEEDKGTSSSSLLATSLREITVVDRSLKPHYLLESAPQLQRLSIAWQEELCYQLDRRFNRDWFSEMIRKPSWVILANKLTRLDISFPASYSCNTYGLPLRDYTELMKNLENLTSLRLVGAKTDEPFPLLPTLK